MAAAIEALQPEYVAIENVRGLLSAPAVRTHPKGATDERCNPETAIPGGDSTSATLRDVEPDPWGMGDESAGLIHSFGVVAGDLPDPRREARWLGLPTPLSRTPHIRC